MDCCTDPSLPPTFAQVILHVYVEDEQRLRCAVCGGVGALIDTIRTKAPQMQVRTHPAAREWTQVSAAGQRHARTQARTNPVVSGKKSSGVSVVAPLARWPRCP